MRLGLSLWVIHAMKSFHPLGRLEPSWEDITVVSDIRSQPQSSADKEDNPFPRLRSLPILLLATY
jgi:hypothetical protein